MQEVYSNIGRLVLLSGGDSDIGVPFKGVFFGRGRKNYMCRSTLTRFVNILFGLSCLAELIAAAGLAARLSLHGKHDKGGLLVV